MQTPYTQQVADAFNQGTDFGSAAPTSFELSSLRALYRANGKDHNATLASLVEHGYPLPEEITPEMVALTGVAHACGVAIHLAEIRGTEGKDSTYESYIAKNRFDRFTGLHLPDDLRPDWNTPIDRDPEASLDMAYPHSADFTKIHGIGKPSRYLPAQMMRHLEFARLGMLDEPTKEAMGISSVEDLNKFAVLWDSLVPVIEDATSTIELAGAIGTEVGKQLLANGLSPEQVAGLLKKSYSIRGIKEEHGDVSEADEVYEALVVCLAEQPETELVSKLISK